jgi:hypothetical protein
VAEGQDRMAFGAVESCLALLPILADTIEVVAVELRDPGRTSTSFDRSAVRRDRRYGSLCSRRSASLPPGAWLQRGRRGYAPAGPGPSGAGRPRCAPVRSSPRCEG